MIVGRGRREGFAGDFGREATSVQDIGILGVASDVGADKTGDFIEVAGGGEGGEVVNSIVVKGGKGGEGNSKDFGFFACFVRTCS